MSQVESVAKLRLFNVNEVIRVKLTDHGLAILKANHDEFAAQIPSIKPWTPPVVDADGWTKMQTWVLMQDLGPHIGIGVSNPIETEVAFEARHLKPAIEDATPTDEGQGVAWRQADFKEIAASVVQSVCEADPADPEHHDTVMISVDDLETIVRCAVENHVEAHPTPDTGLLSELVEIVAMFSERIERDGEWEDACCFYYLGTSASQLEEPLTRARTALAKVKAKESDRG